MKQITPPKFIKWKQFLVVFAFVFPATLVVPFVTASLGLVSDNVYLSLLFRAINVGIIVFSMVYWYMPFTIKKLFKWITHD